MKVLVTGANGLLGHHLVFELLKRNQSVRIIVRSTKSIHFDLNSVEVFIGNFTDSAQLKQAADGCDAIIHVAAITATNLLRYDDYQKINAFGAEVVTKVARELNINRLVFVSTANTIGYGKLDLLADETFPIEFPFSKSFYAQSKVEAESIFINESKMPDKHIVIINPTFMIGAFDPKPSSGKLILMGHKKRLLFIPKGGKNFVHVRDVAVATCNALNQGHNGEHYLASGINLSFAEFYSHQKQIGNYKQVLIRIPEFLMIFVGKTGDLLRQFGIKTELSTMNIRQLMVQEFYSNQKAKTELDLQETDLKVAIKEAIEWFKLQKKV
jgi:nucleoside-diphosphate-sugar epimerase